MTNKFSCFLEFSCFLDYSIIQGVPKKSAAIGECLRGLLTEIGRDLIFLHDLEKG